MMLSDINVKTDCETQKNFMASTFHQLSPHLPPSPTASHLLPPSYSRHPSTQDRVTIVLKCPSLSSLQWCLSLYSLVMGGVGMLFTSLWVVGHGYVLTQTQEGQLRVQRYSETHAKLSSGTLILFIFLDILIFALAWSSSSLFFPSRLEQ